VSLRRMGTLLAVVCNVSWARDVGVRAQDSDNEVVRRAKTKVAAGVPGLSAQDEYHGTVKVQVVGVSQWNGEGREGGWRSSRPGECGARGSTQVAL